MGTTTRYMFSNRDLEFTADQVKAIVIDALVADGKIDGEVAHKWCLDHTIIIRKEYKFMSLLYRFLNLFKDPDPEQKRYIVVKKVLDTEHFVREKMIAELTNEETKDE